MIIDEKTLRKFPILIRNAINANSRFFEGNTFFDYEPFEAFRKVRKDYSMQDFLSYAALGKIPRGVKGNSDSHYACSLFTEVRTLRAALKLNPNDCIVVGDVQDVYGPSRIKDSHVDWWLYEGVDVTGSFRVVDYKL